MLRTLMHIARYALVLLFITLGWLIGWSNSMQVEFSFLSLSFQPVPVYLIYFLFLTVGLLVGLILGRYISRR